MKITVGELIVVEGKDDIAAVKLAIDGEVIATSGYGFSKDLVALLQKMVLRTGIIIFTDPDSAGNQIRRKLDSLVPGCKHAYLPQAEGTKGRNIGIENASPTAIQEALNQVRGKADAAKGDFTLQDLVNYGLSGKSGSGAKRKVVGKALGIGDTNSKQFLSRLNHLGVLRQEFIEAVNNIGGN